MKWSSITSKEICNECGKIMRPAILIYTVQELIAVLVSIYTAKVLGEFANAIFMGQYDFGIIYLVRLLICVVCIVIIVPIVETLGEISMFTKSLDYCNRMYYRFLEKTYESIRKIDLGQIQYSLEGDVIDFYIRYTNIVIKMITLPIAFTYLLFNACKISVLFMALVFGISILGVTVKLKSQKKRTYFEQKRREYASTLRGREIELLSAPHSFILFDIYKHWSKATAENYTTYHEGIEQKNIIFEVFCGRIINFFNYLCSILVLIIGAVMVVYGMIQPGAVAEMIGYFSVFMLLDEKVVNLTTDYFTFKNLLERMNVIYSNKENDNLGVEIERISNITLENISYAYEEADILKNLNTEMFDNSRVAICGDNGSGKSTLIKILSGLNIINNGNIYIDGMPIHKISTSSYRKNIAYVMQEPYLFRGTVKENVAIGNLQVNDNEISKVMKKLGIIHLADKEIDNSNNELSGGEKQKISIARALLRKASVLILDEPENHLDAKTRESVQEIIKEYQGMVIFVSHDDDFKKCSNMQINL